MLKVYSYNDFLDKSKDSDGILCIGTGKRLSRMEGLFANTIIGDKVKWMVDNNQSKQGTETTFMDKVHTIKSLDEVQKQITNKSIILITCVRYDDILEQLAAYDHLKSADWVCLSHTLGIMQEDEALGKKIPKDLRKSDAQLIPKKIHYFWFGGNPLPDRYKIWMESWQKYCPDYEIIQWNESNYDVTKIEYMRQAYENKKWGFVPDYARLDVIYNHGGIYLDTDVELIKNIDDLLYQRGFAGFETGNNVNFGQGFGAVKGLEILKDMMLDYEKQHFVNEDGHLNLVASPFYQTKVLEANGLIKNGEYQVVKDMTIYPEKMLCGKSMATMRVKTTSYTHSIHHFDGSWADAKDREHNQRLGEIMSGV